MSQPAGTTSPKFGGILAGSAIVLATGIIAAVAFDSSFGVAVSTLCILGAWFVPVVLAVRYRDRAKLIAVASKSDVKAVGVKVDESRAKESRHEYHQERSLQRIEDRVRQVHVLSTGAPDHGGRSRLDILFVTSNGAGLGHLSRLAAIANHLPRDRSIEFLTMSTAYERMADQGFTVHYFPSGDAVGEPPETWNPIFQRYFQQLVTELRPSVVVFDGTWVYSGLTDVCRTFGITLVWVQRGMWREAVDENSVQRHNAKSVADHVIIPGDFAGPESVDLGGGIEPHYVGPIMMTEPHDVLSREDACAGLGLDPEGSYVLLSLGGGSISEPDSIAHVAFGLLREHAETMTPVQVVSPLAVAGNCPPGLIRVSAYPVMRYARAFDAMITAAGYNSAQEAVAMGLPSILVPNLNTITDDQSKRAHLLADRGLCWAVGESTDLRAAVIRLADSSERDRMRDRLATAGRPTGGAEAAAIIDGILEHAGWPELAARLERRGN
ncbi:MAG: glycosyltransferase [Brevibacterium sp.]